MGAGDAECTYAQSLIFAICNLASDVQVAQAVVGLCLGFFFTFAGFYINAHSIPDYYVWAKYSSFIKVRQGVRSCSAG